MIESCYKEAKRVLTKNKKQLTELAESLLDKEVIFKEDLVRIFGERPGEEKSKDESEDEILKKVKLSQKKWSILKTSNQLFELEMMKGFLIENGINAIVMNKQDSSYQMFGDGELLVKEEDVKRAKELLNKTNERNA